MSQQVAVFEWLEAVSSPIFVLVEHRIRWANSAAAALTGYDDLDGRDFTELVAPAWQNGSSGVPQGELEILTARGETQRVNITLKATEYDGETLSVATVIPCQPGEPASLSESDAEYRMIAENMTDLITRTSVDGVRTYVSSVCRSLLGYEPEELLGQHSSVLIHPEDLAGTQRAWNAMRRTPDAVTFMCRMQHKNGEYIWFEVVGKAISDPESGAIREYVAVSRDISSRKQVEMMVGEQERLRYELQKEQELNEIKSNLMRTISHEFRTPLALIVTSTDFLDAYLDRLDAERRKERLQAIRIQVKRLSDMLNDISFVVQGTLHHVTARKSRIELKEYCESILEEIQTTIGKNHQFTFEGDAGLEQGIADKALVVRMLTNLLSNAVKYSPEKSLITLRLKLEDGNAVLQVIDQGIGIEPDEQKHIFEPFYRSRSVIDQVGGTGLGLSIVKDCVDLHGGTISVESAPGHGSTFTIRLPQTQDEP